MDEQRIVGGVRLSPAAPLSLQARLWHSIYARLWRDASAGRSAGAAATRPECAAASWKSPCSLSHVRRKSLKGPSRCRVNWARKPRRAPVIVIGIGSKRAHLPAGSGGAGFGLRAFAQQKKKCDARFLPPANSACGLPPDQGNGACRKSPAPLLPHAGRPECRRQRTKRRPRERRATGTDLRGSPPTASRWPTGGHIPAPHNPAGSKTAVFCRQPGWPGKPQTRPHPQSPANTSCKAPRRSPPPRTESAVGRPSDIDGRSGGRA